MVITLPFGLSYARNLFEKFSTALQWILQSNYLVSDNVHILDDFLFLGPSQSSECYGALLAFHELAKDKGLPIKTKKTQFTQLLHYLFGVLGLTQYAFKSDYHRISWSNLSLRLISFRIKNQLRIESSNHWLVCWTLRAMYYLLGVHSSED